MSYFAAQVGQSPLAAPHPVQLWPEGNGWALLWPAPPPGVRRIVLFHGETEPLAELTRVDAAKRRCPVPAEVVGGLRLAWQRGEELGPVSVLLALPSPPAFGGPLSRRERGNGSPLCPFCRGALEALQGLLHCQGRCGTQWVASATGQLLDRATLPFGICGCCTIPQPLLKGDRGILCPASGKGHLLLPDGQTMLAEQVQGLCLCCAPPMPLLPQGEALYCAAKPHQRYQWLNHQIVPLAGATPTSAAEVLDAIDEALRRNSAQLGQNGLFILDD